MTQSENPAAAMMQAVSAARAALLGQCPAPPPPMSPAERADSPVHVRTVGDDGPTVLIVHGGVQGGLGGGPATFAQQEALAREGWRLRFVERPGFGDSPSHGPDDMEADAIWLADLLGRGSHLVGHSWGGAEALLAAARRPDAVTSLTLIEPALMPIIQTDQEARSDPAAMRVGAQMGGMLMQARTPADYALAFARTLSAPDQPNDRLAQLEEDPESATRFGCAMLQARMATPDSMRAAADAVSAARLPVLVVSGGWSPVFDFTSETTARLTGGRFEVVASRDHFVQQSSAKAFNELLSEFMREAEAGA